MTSPAFAYLVPELGEPEPVEVDPSSRLRPQLAEALGHEIELVGSMRWPSVPMMLAVVDFGYVDMTLRVNYRAWSFYGGSPIVGPALVFHTSTGSGAWHPIPEGIAADIMAPITAPSVEAMEQMRTDPQNVDYRGRW